MAKAKKFFSKLLKDKTDNILIQLFRYFVVSGLSFVIDFCTLYIFTEFLGIYYLVSGILSYSIGLVINYFISVHWVFKSRTYEDRKKEFIIFVATGIAGLGINALVLWLCTDIAGLHYMLSRIISAGIGYVWKYVARRALLFRKQDDSKKPAEAESGNEG